MIIYKDTVENFNRDVFKGLIARKLENLFLMLNISKESQGEYRSWNNSLEVVSSTLKYSEIESLLKISLELYPHIILTFWHFVFWKKYLLLLIIFFHYQLVS